MNEKLFKLKIQALLHDPYWKIYNIERHESTMIEFIKDFVKKNIGLDLIDNDNFDNSVKIADMLSSSLDRFPLSFYSKKNPSKIFHEILKVLYNDKNDKLYNVFSQTWEENTIKAGEVNNEIYLDIFNKISEYLKNKEDKDIKEKYKKIYKYFWTWLEIKIIKDYGFVLPQDSRIPMFDILDHIYSTAALINLTYEGGYIVLVDIPGIQKFISKGRKLRDLFAGSWLISIVMYKFLEKIADEYGPDTIVTPTLRLNPFWVNHVSKDIEEIWNDYENLQILPKDWFRYAIIPGSSLIILPKDEILSSKEKVREYLINKFNETIEELLEKGKIVEEIYRLIENLRKVSEELVNIPIEKEEIKNILKGVLIPKIKVKYISKDIVEKYLESEEHNNLKFKKSFLFWYDVIKSLYEESSEENEESIIKYDLSELAMMKVLDKKIKETYKKVNTRLDLCTNCGNLPAVITFKRDKWNEIKNNITGYSLFKPGERLCVVCLFKRITSLNEVYTKMVKDFLGVERRSGSEYDEDHFSLEFLSTTDLTIIGILYKIKEYMNKINNVESYLQDINEKASKYIEEINSKYLRDISILEKLKSHYYIKLISFISEDENLIKLAFKIQNILLLAKLYKDSDLLLSSLNNEEDIANIEKIIEKFITKELSEDKYKDVNNILKKAFENKYYAIIYADGDNIGKLIGGRINEAIYKYYNSLNEYYKDVINQMLSYTLDKKYDEEKEEILKDIEIFFNMYNYVPLSISYQFAISRSLMVLSLLEVKEIAKLGGIIVYAGGDDLLVVAPKEMVLDIVNISRKIFSGLNNGWHKIGNKYYYIQGLGYVGRTYSIIIAHHKDNLYLLLENVRENEKKKDEIKYISKNIKLMKSKNVAIFSYTRNPENVIVIPFIFNEDKFDVIFPVYEYIKKIFNNDKVYLVLDDLKDLISRGRIYHIIGEYKKELQLLSEKILQDNCSEKEYYESKFREILRNIFSKSSSIENEKIDRLVNIDNIFIIKGSNKEHIIFNIYELLKILLR